MVAIIGLSQSVARQQVFVFIIQQTPAVHAESYLQALRRKPIHDHATGVSRASEGLAPLVEQPARRETIIAKSEFPARLPRTVTAALG